jgi:hypothetical protein
VTDSDSCVAVGDVMTIVMNADTAVREGRMQAQEQQGWYRLATRVLDQVPTTGQGAVSDTVAQLQAAAPPIAFGAMQLAGVGSGEWDNAFQALTTSCEDAGAELAIEGFTGG